jgi:succinate dehydrogenase flavin-adding protein (antitoxin of CptAB toxin-antitoxin module)
MSDESRNAVDYLWQCRRGMLELDLLLNNFVEKKASALTEQQKKLLNCYFPIQIKRCSTCCSVTRFPVT